MLQNEHDGEFRVGRKMGEKSLEAHIPEHIQVYTRHLRRMREKHGFDEALAEAAGSLTRIADILRNKTGNDFHGYKQNTFLRRVQRRMQVVQIDEIDAYVEHLRSDKDEAQNLFNDLLIGVTQFFRDKREFETLETDIIPKILAGKGAGQQVRVWVLGCATGEEAYSIGILLREQMARLDSMPHVQIFATDIDGRALAAARIGRYRTTIEKDMTPERLARWFAREGDTYCVVKELREMCIFSQHNVIKDAPFSRLDLVSCRNLLIYLNAELQNRVIPLFHFALLPDRFLFLGNSENVTRHPKLFAPVDRRARIFRKLETGTRLPPEFPITVASRKLVDVAPIRTFGPDLGLERRAHRIAERYSPAFVIVDEDFQILHFSGRTGRFLEPTAGAATLDLLGLVHRDLRLELRAALAHTRDTNEPSHANQVQLDVNGNRVLVDIAVERVEDGPRDQRNFIVLFKEGQLPQVARGRELRGYDAIEGEQLRVSGPVVRFQPKAAETFALAIHELANNALKYGALSKSGGSIDVAWSVADQKGEDKLMFDWRERGGPPVEKPKRRGFGTDLLEKTITFELKGQTSLSFDVAGLHCTISVPLDGTFFHTPPVK